MVLNTRPVILLLLIMALVSCSTSNHGADNPIIPASAPSLTGQQLINTSYRYLWGYWEAQVSEDHRSVVLVPMRDAEMHLNTLRMLEHWPCSDCLKITDIEPSGSGTILVDIELTHPMSNPNLTGFDVRGIALFSGSQTFPEASLTVPDRLVGDGELINPDGYSTLYNITTIGKGPGGIEGYIKGILASDSPPNALLNGYKRFVSDSDENIRNAFYVSDSVTVTYEIDMPDGAFVFGYAVDSNWATPLVETVEDPMTDFPPEASCPEPWQISVTSTSIGQGLNDLGGESILTIDVYDWQGKASHMPPRVECQGLFNGELLSSFAENGDGFDQYQVTVENSKFAGMGTYRCLISVEDVENFTSPDWIDLTAYQFIELNVIEHINVPPVAQADAGPQPQVVCEPVYFFDEGSSDADGVISTYQWDWENDGVFDEAGASVSHSWDSPGIYQVQFRVTDDDGDSDELDEPLEIIIQNALPTAQAYASDTGVTEGNPLIFNASASHDNDCEGEIILYEWDWNNDGEFENTGVEVSHTWQDEGEYEIQLRVTDDEGGTDLLNTPLSIQVIQNYGWANTWGSSVNADYCYGVASDLEGNVFVTGKVAGPTDFDPGPGVEYRDTDNGHTYLAKFTAEGEFVWVQLWGSQHYCITWDAATDPQGNCYVVGEFELTADFDPSPSEDLVTVNDYHACFVVKYDANGNYQWVHAWPIDHEGFMPHLMGIAADNNSNVYICGFFKHELPWYGGVETNGGADCFLLKYDTDGVFQWVGTWGGSTPDSPYDYPSDYASAVTIDDAGDILVTGIFSGDVDFDPGPGAYLVEADHDVFITKFSPNGEHQWATMWGEIGTNTGYLSYGIATDSNNDIYLSGVYHLDAALVRFDSTGNYQWLRYWGYSVLTQQWAFDVAVDSSDNVYVTGQIDTYAIGQIPLDFNPAPDVEDWITPHGRSNSYLCQYDTSGNYIWGRLWGTDNIATAVDEAGHELAVGAYDCIYVCGHFNGHADFDPSEYGEDWHQSTGDTGACYVSKFLPTGYWY